MATIRPYEESDLGACRALWVELTEQHRQIYDVATIGGANPGRRFDEHLARVGPDNLWVAVEDEEVVGLTGLYAHDDMTEIEPVVVTRDRRNAGLGRQLVDFMVDEARRRRVRLLSVMPVARNRDAIRFYHEAGFDVLGYVEMFMDLTADRDWVPGETLAGRQFRV